ncbi:MAG: Gfo/Idh/MocA family oxidoreductase [Planctomycetales bacterium]
MRSERYRVAVIGCTGRGDYGHGLDTVWSHLPETQLIAVADENPQGLRRAGERLKLQALYPDYRDMLKRERPSIVAVAPRWIDQHRDMLLACAEQGCHVYMEKPFCRTLREADEIVDAFERKHLKLGIAHQTRYSPLIPAVKKILAEGKLGTLLEMRGRGKEDARGGMEDLWVLGSHILDLMRNFAGDPHACFGRILQGGESVSRKHVSQGNEGLGPMGGDRVDAGFSFPNGVMGYFASQRRAAGNPSRFGLTLYGSAGVLEIGTGYLPPVRYLGDSSWSPGRSGKKWETVSSQGIGVAETAPPDPDVGNVAAVKDLLKCIQEDRQTEANMYMARWTIEMIMGVLESHRQGVPVSLPLTLRDHPWSLMR